MNKLKKSKHVASELKMFIFCVVVLTVLYPELFWSWYTSLGSQTQIHKCSKVLISGVSFCQCFLSQSRERDVLSYSEHKIAKNFQGFTPGPQWGGLTALAQTLWQHNGLSPHYAHRKTSMPTKKLLDAALTDNHLLMFYESFIYQWFTNPNFLWCCKSFASHLGKPLLFVLCLFHNIFRKPLELGTCFYCGYHF